jgi:hypothetical protein
MSFALKKSHKKQPDVKEDTQYWWLPVAKQKFTKPLESQLELDKIIDRALAGFKTRVNIMGSSRDVTIVDQQSMYDGDVEREILELYTLLMPCILHYSPLGSVVPSPPTSITRTTIPTILSDLSSMVGVIINEMGHQLNPLIPSHVLLTLDTKISTLSGLFTLVNDIFISLDGRIKRTSQRDRMGTGVSKDGDEIEQVEEIEETGEMGRGLRVRRKRQASYDVDVGGQDVFEDKVHKRPRVVKARASRSRARNDSDEESGESEVKVSGRSRSERAARRGVVSDSGEDEDEESEEESEESEEGGDEEDVDEVMPTRRSSRRQS